MGKKAASLSLNESLSAHQSVVSSEVPAFTPILSDCLRFLHSLPAVRCVPAGAALIEQGLAVHNVYLIQSGLVKLVHLNASGRETTIGLRSEGWYAGSISVLLNAPSVYSARAVTPCKVARIAAADFVRCLMENVDMLGHFVSALCFEVASQASMQVEVMSSSAEDRLDHFMRERKATHPSRKTLDPLPALKQMEVAQLLAITPEHLSRLMHKKRDASLRAVGARRPHQAKRAQAGPN